MSDPFGGLAELSNPATGFDRLADGEAMPIQRPLARDYQIPDRGTEPHGVDNDIPTADIMADDTILTEPPETYAGDPYVKQRIAPVPIPVAVIEMPYSTELVDTDLLTLVSENEVVPGYPTLVKGQLYLATARQVLPYDDTRTRVVISNEYSRQKWSTLSSQDAYTFAISTDSQFGTYVILPPLGINSNNRTYHTLEGKNAIYACLVGATAGALTGLPNDTVLIGNVTRRRLTNQVV